MKDCKIIQLFPSLINKRTSLFILLQGFRLISNSLWFGNPAVRAVVCINNILRT
jgi:hypothetical protein